MPVFSGRDGTRLAYRVTEDAGSGEPLLCVPGGPMRASSYLGDLGGLSGRRRLVMLDLRGTGASEEPVDPATYRCDRQVDDLEALREHLGLERVDLLAHSAGGDLAVLYALGHPERVRSLTLVAGRGRALGIDFTVEHRREAMALRKDEPWFEAGLRAFEAVWAGSASEADWEAVVPFFYGRWDAAARAHAEGEIGETNERAAEVYASPGAFDPVAARRAVAGVDAPVLVLAGELDGGPLPRVAHEIAAAFPAGTAVVQPGAGHFPWLDDPRWFVEAVARFLERGTD
ncbi:alpha/beta fold hydrolase [Actinomadura sp. LD22]|uniref:Alpha/beta fold hydrolase n=1 Tax=Actinomadura physcomitrii TaxID=2650748 RepID=A0A6I4MB78_9ACTN|nr:alpha/beta hydrolase [Actinomadura physcomitrii]MWA01051.1 alpha/beta fold hydrolase [Actinomadura physcomitrii]